jgi:SIR2-like domain
VTDLLRTYIIVFVGYAAGDPPVRYLLEGLHARGDEQSARIYAFDRGSAEAVQERWRDRGVRALAYPDVDPQHSALWDTLRAWAERADDPDNWHRRVVELAQQRPTTLQFHQRGHVASLIRRDAGAKLFADADPPPPAEWLCVFDSQVRYAEPQQLYGEDKEFDPLDHYGLDDDHASTASI